MQTSDELPAGLQQSGFTVSQALAEGVSAGRLRGPRFQRPFYGMRTVDIDLDDHVERCRAAKTVLPEGSFFSHRSAALIHGLPLPRSRRPEEVEVSVFEPMRPPELRGVRAHQLTANGHLTRTIADLPALSVEDTWAQLSTYLRVEDLVVVGDFLVTGDEPYSRASPPSSRDLLAAAVDRHGRRRGVRSLRVALERIRYGSLSPQESRLRLALIAAGLPEPDLNFRIEGSDRTLAMVDLAYPSHHVAIEYLGDHHRSRPATYHSDIHRRELLVQLGWNVIFVTSADDFHTVALRTRRALLRSSPA